MSTIPHEPFSMHQVTCLVWEGLDTSASVQLEHGMEDQLAVIVFSLEIQMHQMHQVCKVYWLLAFFFSFLFPIVACTIHVRLSTGSLLLEMSPVMKQTYGWLNLIFVVRNHFLKSYI